MIALLQCLFFRRSREIDRLIAILDEKQVRIDRLEAALRQANDALLQANRVIGILYEGSPSTSEPSV